jgi:small subunit ribosomal protein S17
MPARILNGKVIRQIDNKTLVVDVVYSTRHPLYVKVLKKHKKYLCHFENENVEIGDNILIVESVPISKRKKWKLLNNLK